MTALRDAIVNCVSPLVSANDLYLEEVKVSVNNRETLVQVIVDLQEDELGSVALDRIAIVSKAISKALDETTLFTKPFTLEVSSPGLSRPLVELRHFKRAVGKNIRLELNDGSVLLGHLDKVEAQELVFDDPSTVLALSDVKKGIIEIDFSRINDTEEESPEA